MTEFPISIFHFSPCVNGLSTAVLGVSLAMGCAGGSSANESAAPNSQSPAPSPMPQTSPTNDQTESEVVAPPSDVIDQLLDRIEASAADLKTFTADLRYDTHDANYERDEVRLGRMVYDMTDAMNRRLAVQITDQDKPTIIKDVNVRYVFSGAWLVEVDANEKRFEKRQIVAPGEEFDPLKLGEGPLPLPIGQKKAEVLKRFDVQTVELPTTWPLKNLKNVEGIRLIPKPGTSEAKEFLHVDLFYDRETVLPVGIDLVSAKLIDPGDETSRDRKTVRLTNVVRNGELGPDDEALLNIDAPDRSEGWHVEIKPWNGQRAVGNGE